jgi:hypothetical protein
MNRITILLATSLTFVLLARGQTTNISGIGVETIVFSGLDFSGGVGETAALVDNVAEFRTLGTIYTGGQGLASGSSSPGAVALDISEVATFIVSNLQTEAFAIRGGRGGNASSSSLGSGVSATASGGIGIKINTISPNSFFPGPGQNTIDSILVYGGEGGNVSGTTANKINASGGAALSMANGWLNFSRATLVGGDGGVASSKSSSAVANGGDGLISGRDVVIVNANENVRATGGDGGSINISDGGGSASAVGGRGVNFQGLNVFDETYVFEIKGGTYTGGFGGTVTNLSNTTAISGANVSGGDGFYVIKQNTVVSNGMFVGGDAGHITGLNTDSISDGGAGLHVFFNDSLKIIDGTYKGGAAGFSNGVIAGYRGAGLLVEDTDTVISGGKFIGLGLLVEAATKNTSTDIYGGTFEDVEFAAIAGLGNDINITAGTFENVGLTGAGGNDLRIGGSALFGDLNLIGSGVNTISISNSVASSGAVMQSAGVANFNLWNDANFSDVTVLGGTMNFTNQKFNLINGASFVVEPAGTVNFNDGLELKSGSSFDIVGMPAINVTGGFLTKSNSHI